MSRSLKNYFYVLILQYVVLAKVQKMVWTYVPCPAVVGGHFLNILQMFKAKYIFFPFSTSKILLDYTWHKHYQLLFGYFYRLCLK